MTRRRRNKWPVIGAVLLCIGLPPLLIVVNAASYYSANRTSGTIVTSAGQTREYILYVPKSYDRSKPTPLVISIHGAENWPSFQMNLSQWNALADEGTAKPGAGIKGPHLIEVGDAEAAVAARTAWQRPWSAAAIHLRDCSGATGHVRTP